MTNRYITALMAAMLVSIPFALAAPGNGNGQTKETVEIDLQLTGEAIRTNGGPTSFTFYINATGTGDRVTPNGNGVQIRASGLEAQVVVVDGNGTELENYTALLKFHGQEASHLAQGLEGFKFNMQLTGKRSASVLGNTANPDGRVLAMNSHGTTVGEADDDGAFAVEGRGQTTTKDGVNNGANHYNFYLGGTGAIRAA